MKTNKGITLIALVVTIVVLLILAGVSISMLTGENGIITQAQKSKIQTEIGKEKEYITLSVSAVKGDKISKGDTSEITSSELQIEMNKYTDEATVTGRGTLTVTYESGRSYEVEQDGSITQKEELTPEEANKIVDMLDGNIGVTAGGDVVYIETELVMEEYTSMDTQNRTIITENGVRTSSINCFVDNKGKVYTWGDNLGNGTWEDSNEPICISDITENTLNGKNIIEIQKNYYTIIALDSEGKVYTWGRGPLGNGTYESSNVPICISDIPENALNGRKIVKVQSNSSTVIALDSEGKVYTWGVNNNGFLGDGTSENRDNPVCISDIDNHPFNGKNIASIFIYTNNVIAIDDEGKVYTWGNNDYGELGDGSNVSKSIPICISDLENELKGKKITDIYYVYLNLMGSGSTIIALDSNGKVYAWGDNSFGQIGDGTGEGYGDYNNKPICISDLNNSLKNKKIVQMNIQNSTIIALDDEGKIYTWGGNSHGQLGNGTNEASDTPICISDLSNSLNGEKIVNIELCGYKASNVIVLDEEGKVHTWGRNNWGLLGDESLSSRNVPECITEKTESKLYNKKIKKINFLSQNQYPVGNMLCYITEDGEVIYNIFTIIV